MFEAIFNSIPSRLKACEGKKNLLSIFAHFQCGNNYSLNQLKSLKINIFAGINRECLTIFLNANYSISLPIYIF